MIERNKLKTIKSLIKLMHENGVTQLSVGDVSLTIPKPQTPIKQQIMTISPQETAAIQSAYGNHQAAMDIMNKKPAFTKQTELDELDEILFYHEKV
jgi:hypothetical protein